ncbi:hypothetical protein [Micromonospora tulbaghiae]|uniref:hypothetical protein n=1 Tax=Micromonospora tulbaghiae TaxID=479978 RepID=UPI0033DB7601
MTAVPLPRALRRQPKPRNHGAYHCPHCDTPPLTAHRSGCLIALPYPAEARVFRGLLIGVSLGLAGWVLFLAFLIWS